LKGKKNTGDTLFFITHQNKQKNALAYYTTEVSSTMQIISATIQPLFTPSHFYHCEHASLVGTWRAS